MEYKLIQIVDEHDNFIRNASYNEAVENNLLRRAARVFVFDELGQVLLQQRSAHISQPLKWDNSSAGHVDEGETYEETASRELCEEIGLCDVALVEVAYSFRTGRFFNAMYKAVINEASKTAIQIDLHEVAEVRWFMPSEVDALLQEQPETCADSLLEIWPQFRDKLVS